MSNEIKIHFLNLFNGVPLKNNESDVKWFTNSYSHNIFSALVLYFIVFQLQ